MQPTAAGRRISAAVDSPGRMLSLHSRPVASISRTSAGTASPSASRITSPITRSATSTSSKRPSRRTSVADLRMQCCGGAFGAIFVDEPQSDTGREDASDDPRLDGVTEEERRHRGRRQQHQQGTAQLTPKDGDRAHAMGAKGVRSVADQAGRRLRAGQSVSRAAKPLQHLRCRGGRYPRGGELSHEVR